MHACKFCGREFTAGQKLGGHVAACKLNPNSASRNLRISERNFGKRHTLETREQLSRKVRERVAAGTWHLSFSHARTHEYRGAKFHGTWEVEFAKYLDAIGVNWIRCEESFAYEFEGRTRRYTPDFYILDSDLYVEVKGYRTPKDDAKWNCFPKKLLVLRGEDLVSLGLNIQCKSCA